MRSWTKLNQFLWVFLPTLDKTAFPEISVFKGTNISCDFSQCNIILFNRDLDNAYNII